MACNSINVSCSMEFGKHMEDGGYESIPERGSHIVLEQLQKFTRA